MKRFYYDTYEADSEQTQNNIKRNQEESCLMICYFRSLILIVDL